MKNSICLLVGMLVWGNVSAQLSHSRVKIDLRNTSIQDLHVLGLEVDHGIYAKGRHFISDLSNKEISFLDQYGIDYEIQIEEVSEWYASGSPREDIQSQARANNCGGESTTFNYATPQNYRQGSMGGYLTYEELLATLDEMHEKYPDLITEKTPIEPYYTEQDRRIHWLKVSNNPNMEEDEPKVLYTALHHAREPNSMSQMVFFLWYLLENYETDPEIKYLVDNTQLYFVPCVNPDGYVFNELLMPNGGGLWRKNRYVWPNDNLPYGVDLNRNYGFEWGFDNFGSSTDRNSLLYRGPFPFSEPETRAIRDFCNDEQFTIALNYHSFSNLVIIPFGYNDDASADDATFRAFGEALTRENNYLVGSGIETLGTPANGVSDDWMYGEQESKPKIFAMTPEVGSGAEGFWPPINAIDRLNKANLRQNLVTAHLTRSYAEAENPGAFLLTSNSGEIQLTVRQFGLQTGDLEVRLNPISANVEVMTAAQSIRLAHLETAELNFAYTITPNVNNASEEIVFGVEIDHGEYVWRDTLQKRLLLGNSLITFQESGNGLGNWQSQNRWMTTSTHFVSPPSSIGDSPGRNYPPNATANLDLAEGVDLREADQATLRFWARWDIEQGFDFAQIMASTDQQNYIPLCGKFTRIGTFDQDEGQPVYDGVQLDWVLEEIDISEYAGQELFLRFRMVSDPFVEGEGFFFDDLEVIKFSDEATSIKDELIERSLNIYPNPFKDHIQVELDLPAGTQHLQLKLYNSLGQFIREENFLSFGSGHQQFTWNQPQLEQGMYYIEVILDSGDRIVRKMIHQK